MKKIDVTGSSGVKGWALDPLDLDDYRETIAAAWFEWAWHWAWLRPTVTEKRIAYEDGGLRILTPDPLFFFLLRRGGVFRHMRVIDQMRGIPVFEGTGEVMGSMTEDEAIAFLAWKDIPRGINHVVVIDSVPADRSNRKSWALTEAGTVH